VGYDVQIILLNDSGMGERGMLVELIRFALLWQAADVSILQKRGGQAGEHLSARRIIEPLV